MQNCGPTTSHSWDDELREVAGYRLLRSVGEGGMSRVFLSYDVDAASSVAVKLLADHLAHSREFVGRFYREARLSRLLIHRNLVRGVGAGFDPVAGKHYLILEFIDGPTAQTVLTRESKLPIGVAVQVGIDIASALAFLHSRQYVHRDIKPDNILLHPEGIAKLADLGLAKRLNDDPQITSTQHGVGTSYYMAYEQALNADLVDGRSDIFALGATLYHLLTGHVPFPGSTHEDVIREKEHDTSRPIRELNPEVPPVLAEIITRTLARDPRARIQTAAELVAALEATNLARPIPSFGGAGPPSPSGTQPDSPTRADLPSSNGESGSTANISINGAASSNGPPIPGLPSLRRPTAWLPFRTGLVVLAALTLSGMLAAATGLVSMPGRSHSAPQPGSDLGHPVDSPPTTDGLRPTLSQ
jgi:eukaryotic-like serine/threonine-protein kinase